MSGPPSQNPSDRYAILDKPISRPDGRLAARLAKSRKWILLREVHISAAGSVGIVKNEHRVPMSRCSKQLERLLGSWGWICG